MSLPYCFALSGLAIREIAFGNKTEIRSQFAPPQFCTIHCIQQIQNKIMEVKPIQ